MPRRYVSELTHQEPVDQVFVAGDKQLRPNRNGNLYLHLELTDRTGSIAARVWNANETLYKSFQNGDYVQVEGTAQLFQGAMQIIATKLRKVDAAEIDQTEVPHLPAVAVDKLRSPGRNLRTTTIPAKNPAECSDGRSLMTKFTMAPAGKNHHAYHGDCWNVVNLMEVVRALRAILLNRDLLLGAFLHDFGKTDELSYDRA